MAELKIDGRLIAKLEPRIGGGKEYHTFVIKTDGSYPDDIAMETSIGDVIEKLQGVNIGDVVTCSFNLRSKEYNGKWYTNVNCYKLFVGK